MNMVKCEFVRENERPKLETQLRLASAARSDFFQVVAIVRTVKLFFFHASLVDETIRNRGRHCRPQKNAHRSLKLLDSQIWLDI